MWFKILKSFHVKDNEQMLTAFDKKRGPNDEKAKIQRWIFPRFSAAATLDPVVTWEMYCNDDAKWRKWNWKIFLDYPGPETSLTPWFLLFIPVWRRGDSDA